MNTIFENKQEFIEEYRQAVKEHSGKSFETTSDLDRFNALAGLIASKARAVSAETDRRFQKEGKKRVYYFSIEFLIGRLLDNYLINFGVRDMVADALAEMGCSLDDLCRLEPDAALGNGKAWADSPHASSTRWPMRT